MSRLLRSAPLLLAIAALPLSAQFYNAPANRVTKANGEPSGSLCAASGDVGKVYVVANSASTASPLRICTNTGIGTFAWESSGGGSGSVTPADIEAATWCLAASGSGTTYTCATTNSATLALGQIYNFGIDTTNSGNVTLNVNGQGAKAVLHKNSQQFASGDLVATDSIYLYYDGTQFVPLAEQRSTNQGCIISGEAAANGNETITECAPTSLASSWSIIKPSSAGTAGQVLTSGGAAGQQTWGSAGLASNGSVTTAGCVPFETSSGVVGCAGADFVYNGDFTLTIGNHSGEAWRLGDGNFVGLGGYAGLWSQFVSATSGNYVIISDGTSTFLNSTNTLHLRTSNVDNITCTSAGCIFLDNPTIPKVLSTANCTSAAAPAVCAAASAGSVVVAAAATTVVVNTTAVTANSQILITYDSGLGTKLSVTCNTTIPALYGVTARTAGTSFTLTSTAPITNPACFSYSIVN